MKTEQAISETRAATYKMIEPHFSICLELPVAKCWALARLSKSTCYLPRMPVLSTYRLRVKQSCS